ncbi:MAG: MFS transporter, partial [Dehalococcoidales bacterium]|nr:MFS transporter [Dehalococcoidales bacterium]
PILFVIAFAASMGTVLICTRLRAAVPFGETDQSGFGLFNFILEARQNGLGAFIIFTALMTFTTGISAAFFSVYMLNDLHFTYFTYSLVISTEFMARIGISYLGGRWIDHAGPKKVIRYAAAFLPLIPILWLFSANVGYLIIVQIMSGVAWATFDLCTQSCLCRDTPEGKRLHYIVYHRSIVTLAAAIGPLLGAMVFAYMIPVFGSQILGMFLLSGVLRFLVIAAMLPRQKSNEVAPRDCDIAEFPKIPGTIVIRPTAPPVQSHHAHYPVRKPVWAITENCEPGSLRSPVCYPRPWDREKEKPAAPVKQNIRQDLLYHREDCGRRASCSVEANTAPLRRPPGYTVEANMVSSRRNPVCESGRGAPTYRPPAYLAKTNKSPVKVLRLSDNMSRDIEYHKRWASRVPCPA